MFSTFLIVLPVFALIYAGWLARRLGVFGAQATAELNRFVVYLALPALLFDVVAHERWIDVWQPGFVAAYGLGAAAIFICALAVRLRASRHLADAAIDGLNAAYANTGFVGFPLVLVSLGHDALAMTMIATILTVCVLFAIAIVLIEIGLQTERRRVQIAVKLGRSLACNPLLAAPAVAALLPVIGLTVPVPFESFLKLLGGAAPPCALVALGLFVAEKREANVGEVRSAAHLIALKLLVHPLVTWILASFVFGLPTQSVRAAVLLAALPTGTGPFMLAEFYRREAGITGKVVLVSTIVSVITVSGYLAVSGPAR